MLQEISYTSIISVPLHVVILNVSNSELSKTKLCFLDFLNSFKILLGCTNNNVLSVISCYFFITCMFVRSVIGNCSNIWKEFLHENNIKCNSKTFSSFDFVFPGHQQQVYKIKIVH